MCLTGCIVRGTVKPGDELSILGDRNELTIKNPVKKVTITSIEEFRRALPYAEAGRNVGILLRSVGTKDVGRGQFLCDHSYKDYLSFVSKVVLIKGQDSVNNGFSVGFKPQLYMHTADITCRVDSILNDEGNSVTKAVDSEIAYVMQFSLIKSMVLEVGSKFILREGSKTLAYGTVTSLS